MDPDSLPSADDAPGAFNYILSFLLVGLAWGFTTPFIRRAAVDFNKRNELKQQQQGGTSQSGGGWLKMKLRMIFWTVVNLLRTPAYLIPLVLNLTGSVWFFLLVGKHGMAFDCASRALVVFRTRGLTYMYSMLVQN